MLAIDLGTGSVKALVVDEHCTVLGKSSAQYLVYRPHGRWARNNILMNGGTPRSKQFGRLVRWLAHASRSLPSA
ncbi:MAG: hypothetical protein R2848_10935 [Thermomicrobiales bacterium]